MRTQKSHTRKKASKVTMKTHRKGRATAKDSWQKLFRERFYV